MGAVVLGDELHKRRAVVIFPNALARLGLLLGEVICCLPPRVIIKGQARIIT